MFAEDVREHPHPGHERTLQAKRDRGVVDHFHRSSERAGSRRTDFITASSDSLKIELHRRSIEQGFRP